VYIFGVFFINGEVSLFFTETSTLEIPPASTYFYFLLCKKIRWWILCTYSIC